MKNNKEIEKILLNDKNLEQYMAQKVENEFLSILEEETLKKTHYETDRTKVPKEKLFTKNTTYLLLNKANKTQSFINGLQADGFLGNENSLRQNFISGNTDYFVCDNYYIKFYNYKE